MVEVIDVIAAQIKLLIEVTVARMASKRNYYTYIYTNYFPSGSFCLAYILSLVVGPINLSVYI